MFKQHVFIIHVGCPVTCEYKERGRLRRLLKAEGAVAFFPSGSQFQSRLDTEEGASSTDVFLALDPAFVSVTATKLEMDLDRVELVQQRRQGDPALHHIAAALQHGIQAGDATDLMYCEALSGALTFHLLRDYGGLKVSPKNPRGGLSREKLGRALRYIQDRLGTGLTVSEIAQVVGVSPYHFIRLFKASTGKSPYQYLVEARVRRAKELLATGKFTIGEVANEVGFFDQSHLSRHFKRIFGLPPRALLHSVKRTFSFALPDAHASVLFPKMISLSPSNGFET
jgi:AraC family transcriptional regulator